MTDPPPPVPLPEEDRRDSPRLPLRVMVRDPAVGGSFEERPGDLALGGVRYRDGHPPRGGRLEVRVLLPGTRTEVRCRGEVVRVTREDGAFAVHLRFAGLADGDERAIARLLDAAARGRP